MIQTKLNRMIAIGVFIVSLLVYLITLAPTVVFWDVGEFIAAAKMLQVPHPPGSPSFLLIVRVAMMIPFAADQAVRAHALSALFSALSVMFLYLVIVRIIAGFRGVPEAVADKITVYGSALVGTFSLAFSTTFWDNAIESEVYGASMFFISSIFWLVLRWRDRDGVEGNEKYILLIAYFIGLSLGVHLLTLLAIFPVLMIIYFKRYEYSLNSFVKFLLVSVGVFFVVYPGIVKYLPGMMDGEFAGQKGVIVEWIPWIIIAAVCYGVYSSYKSKQRVLHVALLSIVLILLGYTTYVSVIIRSNAHPPMNENDPSNLARLTSYLNREQYGNAPLFMPRRYSQEPHQQGIYTNYTSDMDFLFRYQLNHMFFRYVFWNYIGSAGDAQDSGVDWRPTLGIPFLIGLLGLYHQFRRDWKMGLVFLSTFIIMGPILALFQNQQEPQPRERDYFYVGAFYVFSLWIALGVVAVIDFLRRYLTSSTMMAGGSAALVGAFALAIPVNLARINWHEHDRSGNYVAWDYSYNMLQTCEKDAILFTNGDNDTFPLWYLQDVEGIRRDVRIVNLSLVNTPWYIVQMKKDPPYYAEAKAVPISLSDTRIQNIQPAMWEARQIDLSVPKEVFQRYGVTDTSLTNRGRISFTMRPTLQFGQVKAIRVQDIMVRNIVETTVERTQWQRPIYFAVTCAPDTKIGLDEYLWFHGLAWKLEPRKVKREDFGVDSTVLATNLFSEPDGFSTTPQYGYKFRNVNNPSVYFDENTTRLMLNYRSAFIRLATHYANVKNDFTKAAETLDRMEFLIPRSKVPMGWDLASDIAGFYYRLGRVDRFNEIAVQVEQECKKLIESGPVNMNSYYNPYRALLEIYEVRKDYKSSLDLLNQLAVQFPNDPGLMARIAALKEQLRQQEGPADTARPQGR